MEQDNLFVINAASAEDVNEIVEVHLKAFNGFFLTSLGPSFLNAYYSSFMKEKNSILLVAKDRSHSVVGFCAGGKNSGTFNVILVLKNLLTFLRVGILMLVNSPRSILRLAMNMRKPTLKRLENDFELQSIATQPSLRGMGIARDLLTVFEKMVFSKGFTSVTLTTDKNENDDVVRFYIQNGYLNFEEFKAYPKREMLRLIKRKNETNT